jgi:hypothetical protein
MNPLFILGVSCLAGLLLGGFVLNMVIYFVTPYVEEAIECVKECAAMIRSASDEPAEDM